MAEDPKQKRSRLPGLRRKNAGLYPEGEYGEAGDRVFKAADDDAKDAAADHDSKDDVSAEARCLTILIPGEDGSNPFICDATREGDKEGGAKGNDDPFGGLYKIEDEDVIRAILTHCGIINRYHKLPESITFLVKSGDSVEELCCEQLVQSEYLSINNSHNAQGDRPEPQVEDDVYKEDRSNGAEHKAKEYNDPHISDH